MNKEEERSNELKSVSIDTPVLIVFIRDCGLRIFTTIVYLSQRGQGVYSARLAFGAVRIPLETYHLHFYLELFAPFTFLAALRCLYK